MYHGQCNMEERTYDMLLCTYLMQHRRNKYDLDTSLDNPRCNSADNSLKISICTFSATI